MGSIPDHCNEVSCNLSAGEGSCLQFIKNHNTCEVQ